MRRAIDCHAHSLAMPRCIAASLWIRRFVGRTRVLSPMADTFVGRAISQRLLGSRSTLPALLMARASILVFAGDHGFVI